MKVAQHQASLESNVSFLGHRAPCCILRRRIHMACGVCGQEGHNRRTCSATGRAQTARPTPRTSGQRHCSNCGSPNHDIRTCSSAQACTQRTARPSSSAGVRHCGNCGGTGHDIRNCVSSTRELTRRSAFGGVTRVCGIDRCVDVSARDMALLRRTNEGVGKLRAGESAFSPPVLWKYTLVLGPVCSL